MFSPSLFPDADYAHRLTVKRGDLRAFFAATDEHHEIMAERRRWLAESPREYVAASEDAAALVNETARLVAPQLSLSGDVFRDLIAFGCAVEPDIVLLKRRDDVFHVVGGCVCFPSSWSLPEKLGMALEHVHAVVPNLNASIGPPISRFLAKMQPGTAWERSNWGLSAVADRNQHPTRNLPRLTAPVSADNVWLRVEDQILAALPETGGLLFGIRIVRGTIAQVQAGQPTIAERLRRALATMPDEMARYKNLAEVRSELIELLRDSASRDQVATY